MRYVIFGESHGPAIGVTLTGVPAALRLDLDAVQRELDRRAPGRDAAATARKESDAVHVLSGVFEGKTTGAPLTMVIQNSDQHSTDYDALRYTPRPSHGDFAGFVASKGALDYRGGGHFSGRLTAPLVAAGAVAKQVLATRGICVVSHIHIIGGEYDDGFDLEASSPASQEALDALSCKPFPVLNDAAGEKMRQAILDAKADGDSVGGSVQCAVLGLPVGLGGPDFGENAEGIFAQHLFAIPAVKAVEFGAGTSFAYLRGSEANDPLRASEGNVKAVSNHAGGINGGITNGSPLVFEVTFRPTPSIALPQQTVDLRTGENVEIAIRGRHDPCVVPRAVPVVEAAAALAACQLLDDFRRSFYA